ncbi:putative lipid II flippase FtsW [bacterium]|nr:putative lipid II flippase FtsW [bacterium]
MAGVDPVILILTAGLVIFGLVMVYSSSFIFAQERTGSGFSFIFKQLIFAVIGAGALVCAAQIPYQKWKQWAYPLLGSAAFLLLLVLIPGIGAKSGGAQRWVGLGGLRFQPSEWAKFVALVFIARQLTVKQAILHRFLPSVGSVFLLLLPLFGLLLLQPDFGSTMVIVGVAFIMLFLAGVPMGFIGGMLTIGASAAALLVMSSSYRRARVMTFLDPWQDPSGKGFQVLQSMVGLHSGSITGVGLGNGKEKLLFLPEAHNDFIFSVIGEELGFVGVAAVIVCFLIFVHRGLMVAMRCKENRGDYFGMLLAAGITLILALQGMINMAVVMGLVPTKGLALPFISYGGSALVVDLFAVGVLLNISRESSGKVA